MRAERGGFVASMKELRALMREVPGDAGALGLPTSAGAASAPDWGSLGADEAALVRSMARTLRAPSLRVRIRGSIGPDRVFDQLVAADGSTGVRLTVRNEDVRLEPSAPDIETEFLGDILGVADDPAEDPASVELTAAATLTFLAAVEHFGALRVAGAMTGRPSPGLLTGGAVSRRLSAPHDRFPLGLLAAVLPARLPDPIPEADLRDALSELESSALLERVEGTSLIELTPEGTNLADRLMIDGSRVALGVSRERDGAVGHEGFLFVRGPRSITLAAVSGSTGLLTGPSGRGTVHLLSSIFSQASAAHR